MKVILLQDVRALGRKGDVKEVATGYANNYLFPKQLAQPADRANLNSLNHELKLKLQREASLQAQAEKQAAQLKNMTIRVQAKAGEGGRLFGSVTNGDIAAALAEQGFNIDKKKIDLPEPIKNLGEGQAIVKLYQNIQATLKLEVYDANK